MDNYIKSYLENNDSHKITEYRNNILLSVVSQGSSQFVKITHDIYNKADDLLKKRDVIQLLYEIISRTNDIFDSNDVLILLSQSLSVTICNQCSIFSIKSLLERHVKLHSPEAININNVQLVYGILLKQNISSQSQEFRLNFLWITNYIIELYEMLSITHDELFATQLCDVISGEKDPRNLLVMFMLIPKISRKIAKSEQDYENIAKLFLVYYPINFNRPKNDKIGITCTQLKYRLLHCFKSDKRLGKYVIETFIDSLYSDFNNYDDNLSMLEDALYFITECSLVYDHECFTAHFKSLVDVVTAELLIPLNENGDVERHLEYEEPYTISSDGESLTTSTVIMTYYNEWSVDRKLKVYGNIIRMFVNSTNVSNNETVAIFLDVLRNCLFVQDEMGSNDINGNAGYILDVMSEYEHFNTLILKHVIIPSILKFKELFKSYEINNTTQSTFNESLSNTLKIIINIFAKLISNMKFTRIKPELSSIIIDVSLYILNFDNVNGLKLLILGCISSKTIPLIEQVIKKCFDIIMEKDVHKNDIILYLRVIVDVYRFHESPVVNSFVDNICSRLLESIDNKESLNELMVINNVDISRDVIEMLNLKLLKSTNCTRVYSNLYLKCMSVIVNFGPSVEDVVLLIVKSLNKFILCNTDGNLSKLVEESCKMYLPELIKMYNDVWMGIRDGSIVFNRVLSQLIVDISTHFNYGLNISDSILYLPLLSFNLDSDFIKFANSLMCRNIFDHVNLLKMECAGIHLCKRVSNLLCNIDIHDILKMFDKLHDYYRPFITLGWLQFLTRRSTTRTIGMVRSSSIGNNDVSIPLVSTDCLAVRSFIYLPVNGIATPRDRGEVSKTIYGSRGDINREATTASGTTSGGAASGRTSGRVVCDSNVLKNGMSAFVGFASSLINNLLVPVGNVLQFINCIYPYDYKSVVNSITILDLDKEFGSVVGLDYNDLFFTYRPDPLESSSPLIINHLLYMRKATRVNYTVDMKFTKTLLDSLYNNIYVEKTCKSVLYSFNLEADLMLLLPLLSLSDVEMMKFTNCITCLLDSFMAMDVIHSHSIDVYEKWCRDQYIISLQTLILRVLYNVTKDDDRIYPFDFKLDILVGVDEGGSNVDILEGRYKAITEKMIQISQSHPVPFSRIMGILVINYIMQGQYLTAEDRNNVIKCTSKCLGDCNRRVRTMTLLCRQKWINNC